MLEYLMDKWPAAQSLLQMIIQIGLLSMLLYIALLFFSGYACRSCPWVGIVIIIFVGWFLAAALGLEELRWLLEKLPALLAFRADHCLSSRAASGLCRDRQQPVSAVAQR